MAEKKSTKAKKLKFQPTSRAGKEYRTWFRGEHTNPLPHNRHMYKANGIQKYVLSGWTPEAPVITARTQVTAFGSCFAANISNWLSKRSYNVLNKSEDAGNSYVVECGEGMVNSFVILQQFEWAWENKVFDQDLWHGYDTTAYGYDPEVQAQTKKMFDETDVFILTFGLSEIWYDEPTGNVFWRTIPKDAYDPERHKFRVSSVEENKANMAKIYDLIRKHRPDAKIIFTLSPIPLQATFRPNSCMTSSSVSKSVLRVAIDEIVREKKDEGVLHYWPSYELVTDAFQMPFKQDRRHVKEDVLDYIMMLFETTWCVDSALSDTELLEGFIVAGATAGIFPGVLKRIIEGRKAFRMDKILEREELLPEPFADKALRGMLSTLAESWRTDSDGKQGPEGEISESSAA
ncbi:MAG: GSCFA domain-containing protein [Pseudomonadota bacterium]